MSDQTVSGVLDITDKGYGFLRSMDNGFAVAPSDPYVGQNLIRKHSFKKGMFIEGTGARKSSKQPNVALERILKVDGMPLSSLAARQPFSKLSVIDPSEKLILETGRTPLTTRIIDLFAPIGMGQRALIVSPPKAGKTTFLEDIARGVRQNHPDVQVITFLIDERPEEVTHFRRTVGGEILATSFDAPLNDQIRLSELAFERVTRMVEAGQNVLLIVDSLTRMGRAFNKATETKGKTLSGGVASSALQFPRKFFGAARNIEGGGSLTIVATCLIDTGSRMDEVIFQEFKGTGNTEIVLDRSLAEERVFPAVNLSMSGTRKEEKLQKPADLAKIWTLVRALSRDKGYQKYKVMLEKMLKQETNADFLATIPTT
ncbi:MAG: transcription termination factor Rho [Nitrospinota bacterium]|nr:transcription termination factor Rho [Nitrospinota bacterium]MDH5678934.1 transcription termination factor Rho [Nitrospinota bacterium]MDH5755219.1 transcription termination factor Rho [Nitrospinota bacterium]